MNKLFAAVLVAASLILAGSSAHAGIFSDVGKNTKGVGNVEMAQAKNTTSGRKKIDWPAVIAQRKKFEDANNYRSCVNLYGGTSAAVKGCQRVWNKKLPNAWANDGYRRCVNLYGFQPCERIWAGKL